MPSKLPPPPATSASAPSKFRCELAIPPYSPCGDGSGVCTDTLRLFGDPIQRSEPAKDQHRIQMLPSRRFSIHSRRHTEQKTIPGRYRGKGRVAKKSRFFSEED